MPMSTHLTDHAENEGNQPKKRAPRRAQSSPKADAVAELSAQVATLMAEVGRLKAELEETRASHVAVEPSLVAEPEPEEIPVFEAAEPLPAAEPEPAPQPVPAQEPSVLEWDEAAPTLEEAPVPEGLSAMIPPPQATPLADESEGLMSPDEIAALLSSTAAPEAAPSVEELGESPSAPSVEASAGEPSGVLGQNEIGALLEAASSQNDDPAPAEEPAGVMGYDPNEFQAACEYALAHPDPVVWDDSVPEDPTPPSAEEVALTQRLAEQMQEQFPELIDAVDQYNTENPADFVAPSLGEAVGVAPTAEVPESPVLEWSEPQTPAPQAIDQDANWGELVAEAAPSAGDEPGEGEVVTLGFSALQGGSPLDVQEAGKAGPEERVEETAEDALLEAIAQAQPAVTAPSAVEGVQEPEREAISAVPAGYAIASLALPLRLEGQKLYCLVAEPVDQEGLRTLADAVSMEIEPMPAPIAQVVSGLRKAYGSDAEDCAREALLAPAPPAGGLMARVRGLFRRAS